MPQFSPGEIKTAVASMSNPTGKGFSYTAELYLGLPKAASSGVISFPLAAGETRVISFPVTMPDVEGTYPVYLDVFVAGQLIGAYRATKDVAIAAPGPTISASWQTYFTSRYGGGQFVIATVKVSSPRAFVGRVVVSLPGMISGDVLLTPEQWQALLAQMQWILDNYCPRLADPWRCEHTYELGMERVSAWPTIEGFYWQSSGVDDYYEFHIAKNLPQATSERHYDVDAFPTGDTEIQFAFFIKAGKVTYSDGRWCIGYEPGLHLLSPAVTLYEYVNPYYDEKHYLRGALAQLASIHYEDAIQFEGRSAGTYDWAQRYCSW